jgi:hypothetical protein
MWVGHCGPVHPDVVIIKEIQDFFLGELSAVVSDDGVWDLETKMMS